MTTLAEIPLRQRKQAQTRLALLDAVLARLDGKRTLDDIPVKELCDAANISQASFFNYFPSKTDLLVYFVQIWSLDLAGRVHTGFGGGAGGSAREAIESIFVSTAREARQHPGVMAEIIAHQARMMAPPVTAEISLAERLLAFPGRPELVDLPAVGLEGLLPPLLARAVAEGELPATVDQLAAFLGLTALFFGVPLVLARRDPALVEPLYRQQLAIYWAGLGATPASPSTARPGTTRKPARTTRKPRRTP